MDLFSKNFIKDLGLENLSEEKQKEIILSAGRLVYQNVVLRVLDELSEADKDELDKLLAAKKIDDGEVFEFLDKKVKNLDALVEEEIAKFKQSSAELLKKMSA